ncbi:alpha/beta fold hydrolase [Streptomyces millisiae]|uniref:Alpha/beta hydrolase n=1 Tax=Streptomyces millisiae TaxID=3075542 RepID=A0ABU2LMF0_9ACTN|nr:alpha/beta hydrolase [Streptomyces sp. DSM 44918]MDT0318766.1 alpha/beta hydrolase [Streptomyces sp. DSM 44918]
MVEWRLSGSYRSGSGTVRWERFGESGAEPVVLLHGTPFSSFVWRGVARGLAGRYATYVWDMPGYGVSEKAAGQDLSLAALGEVFAGLLDHWGVTRPRVVAHDSGGAVALGAHLLHGVEYRRLALVDAVTVAPWGSPFFREVGESTDVLARLPAGPHEALLRAYVSTASGPGLRPEVMEALVRPWLGEEGQAAFYRQLAARRRDKEYTDVLERRYERVVVPTLACWGAEDSWVPVERGREFVSRVRGARLHVVPDAGHLTPEDGPAELAAVLATFLAGDDAYQVTGRA